MKKIAFQGEKGAYSELAALKFFKTKITTVPHKDFEHVFNAVISKKVDFGVIPIENSLGGSIHRVYDLLLEHKVWICGEYKLRVNHNLITSKKTKPENIEQIYSHPQAFLQCRNFLKSKFKNVQQIPCLDTAGAVKMIKDNGWTNIAAIASTHSAKEYDMKIMESSIEDNEKNYTRFFILSKNKSKPIIGRKSNVSVTTKCKTSIAFALKNIPGALFKSLSVFAMRDIDLYKIESRPIPGSPWKYLFYLDFKGDIKHKSSVNAIDHLGEITRYLKVLGSYYPSK